MSYPRTTRPFVALISVVAAIALTGCGSSDQEQAVPSSTTSDVSTTRPCETTDLTASITGAESAGGERTVGIRLLNGSNSACSLTGGAQVEVAGADGPITSASGTANAEAVEVDAGSSGYFDLTYSLTGSDACAAGEQLVITPPGQSATLLLPMTLDEMPTICADSQLSAAEISLST